MSAEKTTILNLNDVITNPDGSNLRDSSKEDRSPAELAKLRPSEILAPYPDFTVGKALLGFINTRKYAEGIDDMSKLTYLMAKVRNKMKSPKGEWVIEKQELLDLQEMFKKSKPETMDQNIHGQVYNKIVDLLNKIPN